MKRLDENSVGKAMSGSIYNVLGMVDKKQK
mgnify:CR=1 FL=1